MASDGHSYECEAIQRVLSSANKRSPLTREALTDVLQPNRALRCRILRCTRQSSIGWRSR